MDNNYISDMMKNIIDVQKLSYKAGYDIGYQKGLLDGKEQGLAEALGIFEKTKVNNDH